MNLPVQVLCRCGQPIEAGRIRLSLTTCLVCGDKDASREIAEKLTRVGPVWNKGGDMYLGSPEVTKQVLKEGGSRKNIPLAYSAVTGNRRRIVFRHSQPNQKAWRGRVVGVGWVKGDRRYIYDHDDPSSLGVERFVPWPKPSSQNPK